LSHKKAKLVMKRESENLKVIQLKDEADKFHVSVEEVRLAIEKALSEGKTFGVIVPAKSEVVYFEAEELDALVSELASGRISLDNLGAELGLSVSLVRLVLEYLLKTNKISGVLTYSDTFISDVTLKKEQLAKAKAQKRNCLRKHGLI
jgi:hypothetical protein